MTLDSHATETRSWTSRIGISFAITAAFAIALVATAMVFAIASGTRDAASRGEIGILSEASLSAAAAARNATAQAQVIADANQLGLATDGESDRAQLHAEDAATELARRIGSLATAIGDPASAQAIEDRGDAFLAQIDSTIAAMRAGDISEASQLTTGDLDEAYGALAVRLATERDGAMARVALAGEDAGRIADAARFMVVLLVPLAVLLAYRKRVRREQAQRDLQHQLEKQQAVSKTKDEFIANLSHELRTPLTAIYGFSLELIEPERPKNAAFEQELAKYIASESADLSRMVEDILAAASADQQGLSISLSTVDPVSEIDSVLGALRATGARIESDLTPAQITTDALRFRQIIRNLVSNALRHGGPNNMVSGRSEEGQYVVEVRDDGPGIPEDLQDRLFSRFIHRGAEPLLTGSVGLGLAIVRLLATKTGGTISYRREDDETVFAVSFPLATPGGDGAARAPHHRHHPTDHRGGKRPTRPPRKPDLKNFVAPHPTPSRDNK